jgi:hypothetical protein
MMTAAWFILIGFLILLIIANFVFQIIVAQKVYDNGLQRFLGIMRGTRTFIRGWRFADELKIRDMMVIWSAIVGVLVVWVIAVAILAAVMDINEPTVSSSAPVPTIAPTAVTLDGPVCGITRPQSGVTIVSNITVEGFVIINPSYLDFWQLSIYPTGQPDNATLLREPSNIPFPEAQMHRISTADFGSGNYTVELIAVLKNLPDTIPNPCIDQVTLEFRE